MLKKKYNLILISYIISVKANSIQLKMINIQYTCAINTTMEIGKK